MVPEPKKVEINVGSEKKATVIAPANDQPQDSLSQLSSEIMRALCFDSIEKTEEELRSHNSQLQNLLGKVSHYGSFTKLGYQ